MTLQASAHFLCAAQEMSESQILDAIASCERTAEIT
jgi:hypothetical protein